MTGRCASLTVTFTVCAEHDQQHTLRIVLMAFCANGKQDLVQVSNFQLAADPLNLGTPWPHLPSVCREDKGLPDGLRDVDFSAGHQQRVVAVACEDGSCSLWDWERGLQLLKLALPEGQH